MRWWGTATADAAGSFTGAITFAAVAAAQGMFEATVAATADGTELQRTQARNVEGVRAPVASPEDLIVVKALAGREKDPTNLMTKDL